MCIPKHVLFSTRAAGLLLLSYTAGDPSFSLTISVWKF